MIFLHEPLPDQVAGMQVPQFAVVGAPAIVNESPETCEVVGSVIELAGTPKAGSHYGETDLRNAAFCP
jgi:hypothetical protein